MNLSDRSDYKKTWENLSQNFTSAQHYVAGHNDEAEFERSAEVTLNILRETVGVNKEDTFLEIGCGVGRVGKALSPFVNKWIGTDISSGMIAQARQYLSDHDNIQLETLENSTLNQIEDASVDVVYCTVELMHLLEWDRFQYIKDTFRVLKPGGRAYFDNVDITSPHGWKVFSDGLKYEPKERPAHLSMVSSADELQTYGFKAGFHQCRIYRWGGAWVALVAEKQKG